MYRIDRASNRVQHLTRATFAELGFKERANLQEWIANDPMVLGEDLLIIQKEFAGFSDTNERLDLLALDRHGNLVVIENKLDDSGRDVTWQALKYASYCSSLTKEQIRDIFQDYLGADTSHGSAEERLVEFFDYTDYEELELNKGLAQRIVLVAASFRKEVTSTVLWLMNYRLRIQCFKVTPYRMGEELLLNFEQIIPVPDAEEFMVSMAGKNQGDLGNEAELARRHRVRLQFWERVLEAVNARSDLYKNVSSKKDNWLSAGSGVGGVGFNMAATGRQCRVEVFIGRSNQDENTFIFDRLLERRPELEQAFGEPLIWDRLVGKKSCLIKAETEANIFDKEQWPQMVDFLADRIVRMDRVFRGILQEVGRDLRSFEVGPIP
jgi:hypothetical protein